MQFTIKAKIKNSSFDSILAKMAEEISPARRSLFVQMGIQKRKVSELKKEFISQKKLTARQFNSIRYEVQGLIRSQKEITQNLLDKIKKKKKHYLEKLNEAKKKKQRFKVHQYQRKVHILDLRTERYAVKLKKPSICFGSKKLFKQQNYLKENGLKNHQEWKKLWKGSRDSSFFLIGSRDESFGNQSCQFLPGRLRLRLTHSLAAELGKSHIEIPIEFTYQEHIILAALALKKAINYRFIREKNGFWYVHLTTQYLGAEKVTNASYGALGVDLNPSCIAVTQVDPHGNLTCSWEIPIQLRGKRSQQSEAVLGDAIADLVTYAQREKIPIVIEKLDFEEKKQELRSRGLNRMLSSFAYSKFHQLIYSRALKAGVDLIEINPAYTSIIGKFKFSVGYGLSTHMAAAMAIARRGLGFGEQLRSKTQKHFPLPARTRGKHVWSDWRRLNQEAKRKRVPLRRQQPDCTQGDKMSSQLTPKGSTRTRKDFENEATPFH